MGVRGYEATADGSEFDSLWTEDVAKALGRVTDVGLFPVICASYIVFLEAGVYYARNGKTGVIADSNAVLLTLTQALNDSLTAASGGVIYLKDLEEPGTTLDDDVLVIEDFEGIHRVYSNQGQYMPFSQLAADPATGGWGAAEEGYWWYNTTTNVFKYWNGVAVVTFSAGVGGGGNLSPFFPVPNPDTKYGAQMLDGVTTTISMEFIFPSNYNALTSISAIVLQIDDAGNGDMVWTVATDFGITCTEDYDENEDTAGATSTITQDELECLDVSAAFTGVTAGDLVQLDFTRVGGDGSDTLDEPCYFKGVKLVYTT